MDLTPRFTAALVYAAELHAAQRRKISGAPYVAHLLGVTATSSGCPFSARRHGGFRSSPGRRAVGR